MKLHYSMYTFLALFICQELFSQQYLLAQEWEQVETMTAPIARHENGFVSLGGHFYLLGGRGLKKISIYDIDTNTWTVGKQPPIEIHHFQGVAYRGRIYVVAAMTGKYPYEKPLSHMLVYDPKTDQWQEGPEIPVARRRGSAGVVVNKDKLYIISGIVDGHNSQHVRWVDTYDFKTKKWQLLADAPRPRDHFHAAYYDGKIYAAGGRNSSYTTKQTFELTIAEVDVYDIATNTWVTLPSTATIPTPRAGTSSVFYKDNLFVIGGESSELKTAHDTVEVYNVTSQQWYGAKKLKRARHGTQAVLYNNVIYISAGSGNRGGRPELSSLERLVLTEK